MCPIKCRCFLCIQIHGSDKRNVATCSEISDVGVLVEREKCRHKFHPIGQPCKIRNSSVPHVDLLFDLLPPYENCVLFLKMLASFLSQFLWGLKNNMLKTV